MAEPIRALIFDFGSVLSQPLAPVLEEVEREFGLPPKSMMRHGWGTDLWHRAEVGAMTYDAYREGCIAGTVGDGIPEAKARQAWQAWYDRFYTTKLMPGIPELLDRLHGRYPLSILSNAAPEMEHRIATLCGLGKYFDPIISSATIGVAKPNPKAWQITLDAIGQQAEHCYFVDDTLPNVVAAQAMGIRSYHFGDTPGLIEALKAEGVAL